MREMIIILTGAILGGVTLPSGSWEHPAVQPTVWPRGIQDTTITISPPTATLAVGQSLRFRATVRFHGDTVPWPASQLRWVIRNPAVATDNGAGLVKAVAPGSTVLWVTTTTRPIVSDSAFITVDTATVAGECAAAKSEWLWCDDFEADRLASYFEYNNARFQFVRDSNAGRNNSFGMRARFRDGRRTAGALKVAVGKTPPGIRAADSSQVAQRELYWRVFVRQDSGWTADRGARLIQGTSLVNRRGAQAMAAYVWTGDARPDRLAADPARGTDEAGNLRTTRYDDFANLHWLGPVYSKHAVMDSSRTGQWQCVEASARLNTAGQSDGRFRLWVNDSLEADSTGYNFVGDYRDYGLNAVIIENVLGRPVSQTQQRRYDNLVVSTARIGCAAGSR